MNDRNQEGCLNSDDFSFDNRKAPPSTTILQQSILEKTKGMPQRSIASSGTINSHSSDQRNWFSWRILPVSGVAVAFILSITVLFNGALTNSPETIDITDSDTLLSVPDDLIWQDVMLMHDELAFLDL